MAKLSASKIIEREIYVFILYQDWLEKEAKDQGEKQREDLFYSLILASESSFFYCQLASLLSLLDERGVFFLLFHDFGF